MTELTELQQALYNKIQVSSDYIISKYGEEHLKLYRIPAIEEFVDGFTYEIYSEGWWEDSIEDFCGWYEYTVGKDCWRHIDQIKQELLEGNIAVRIN